MKSRVIVLMKMFRYEYNNCEPQKEGPGGFHRGFDDYPPAPVSGGLSSSQLAYCERRCPGMRLDHWVQVLYLASFPPASAAICKRRNRISTQISIWTWAWEYDTPAVLVASFSFSALLLCQSYVLLAQILGSPIASPPSTGTRKFGESYSVA